MRSLLSAFTTELAQGANAGLALLVSIGLETPVYRTTWNRSTTHDSLTYVPDVLSFGEVGGALRPASPLHHPLHPERQGPRHHHHHAEKA